MVGVNLPVKASGLLLKRELKAFAGALESPKKPFLAILGGAKVTDKIQLIDNLLDKVDEMIIGGGMSWTFKAVVQKLPIGGSLFDKKGAEIVQRLVDKAKARGVKLHFPVDYWCGDNFAADCKVRLCSDRSGGVPEGWMGMDCGPETCRLNAEVIWRAKTIILNG